jgi:hypothetical protein
MSVQSLWFDGDSIFFSLSRWRNVLDPDIDHGEWRPEEDSKLLSCVHEIGACWSKIAGAMIPHRTDNMCMR